ncbi:hypothetical protein EI94DRAFT_1802759 [Lactarius quietus]|nr:hypothetical protein EI94DRAFT_1802759 [Lactarius quietus]
MANGLEFEVLLAHVGTFPIELTQAPTWRRVCLEALTALERHFNGIKLIFGVDRLDYIKGVPQKFHTLELFLTQHPE